jgi:hypothetical protein
MRYLIHSSPYIHKMVDLSIHELTRPSTGATIVPLVMPVNKTGSAWGAGQKAKVQTAYRITNLEKVRAGFPTIHNKRILSMYGILRALTVALLSSKAYRVLYNPSDPNVC